MIAMSQIHRRPRPTVNKPDASSERKKNELNSVFFISMMFFLIKTTWKIQRSDYD